MADQDRLARTGDIGLAACAIRLRAARHMTGLMQIEICKRIGIKNTTYSNMEGGLSYPSREVMRWLFRNHRIDFNFMIAGEYAQLPANLLGPLFEALAQAERDWDRKAG